MDEHGKQKTPQTLAVEGEGAVLVGTESLLQDGELVTQGDSVADSEIAQHHPHGIDADGLPVNENVGRAASDVGPHSRPWHASLVALDAGTFVILDKKGEVVER